MSQGQSKSQSGTYASEALVAKSPMQKRQDQLRELLKRLQDPERSDSRQWSNRAIAERAGKGRLPKESISHMVGPRALRDPETDRNLMSLTLGLCITRHIDKFRAFLNADPSVSVESIARLCRAGLAARVESAAERKVST